MMSLFLMTVLIQRTLTAPQLIQQQSEEGNKIAVELTKFHVNTTITFRYSRTEVTAHFRNPGTKADKAVFSMLLPQSAFISNFSMTINDEEFVAEVKEKEEAKELYDDAVTSGLSAGLVSKKRRDSNTFTVDTNLQPGEKVAFRLTYEELLERQDEQYEYVLHIDPGVALDDFHVEVNINESLPLSHLSVPELLESNEIDFSKEETESSIAEVTRDVAGSPNNARIVFSPSKEYQVEAGDQGVSGRFVVRYDVDRQGQDSELQVIDGYFVHYFVPSDLPTLPKHVVFVLDTSGSMSGEKIQQLKDAMFTVVEDLTESDYFNVIEFNSEIAYWNGETFATNNTEFYKATVENKNKAIKSVINLSANGGTNLNDAIIAGLDIAQTALEREAFPKDVKSMVVFLTDGLPSEGETNPDTIKSNIKNKNRDLDIPVFTVAFGADTDISLLQSLSSQNNAISKRIYEGSDAALQLEDFYAQISSPLLSDLKFEYVGGIENSSISETNLKTFFKRKEFIVSGKLSKFTKENIGVKITGLGKDGVPYNTHFDICLRASSKSILDPLPSSTPPPAPLPSVSPPCLQPRVYPKSDAQNFLQKLFAFQHIKQSLEKGDIADDEKEKSELRDKATKLSLENNLVTDVTSLVVIKPDDLPPQLAEPENIEEESLEISGGSRIFLKSASGNYNFKSSAGLRGSGFSFKRSRPRPRPRPLQISAITTFTYTTTTTRPIMTTTTRPITTTTRPIMTSTTTSNSSSECRRNSDCPSHLACFNQLCVDPCSTGPCGTNAECQAVNHLPNCVCLSGYIGDPFITCRLPPPEEIILEEEDEEEGDEDCVLSLYSKTYHRGAELELVDSDPDLTDDQFERRAVSALVTGQCCWILHSQTQFGGEEVTLTPAQEYTSVTSLANLFRNVLSVTKIKC